MAKTKKTRHNIKTDSEFVKGGKVIASGGYGCIFDPALKCEGKTKRETNKVSKLMTDKHAIKEYEEINSIKEKLQHIRNYEDYFLINNVSLCRPAKLTETDLALFGEKCTALPKDDINKENINSKLDEVMALNLPHGGEPVDDYIYRDGSYKKLYEVHSHLVDLFKNGILPMNKLNIYHSDLKDSNVLIEDIDDSSMKARLIDWGLSVNYIPGTSKFPHAWKNRPIQFNVPFSVVIFTDTFYDKYSKYLKDDGKVDDVSLRPFVIDYLNEWMKARGAGHYKFINEIMFLLYSSTLSSVSEGSKAAVVEAEITMPIIVDYIIDVLVHYTKFKADGSLNLREYLNKVYVKIVDVWGFINIYYPFLEMLANNYMKLSASELKMFKQLQFIFNEYLYNPRHEPIDMDELFGDLKRFGNFIYSAAYGKRKTSSSKSSRKDVASGIHHYTRKNNKRTSPIKSSIFKRKPLKRRFKNPLFLSFHRQ
jgi:serine/threonine protein kinase